MDAQGFARSLSPAVQAQYAKGRLSTLVELQKAVPNGPIIANHAYGPPFDNVTVGMANAAMLESCPGRLSCLVLTPSR